MRTISAQISIYPLRHRFIGRVVGGALNALQSYDIDVTTGPMSTSIAGEDIEVFSAVRACFLAACAAGDVAMVMTVSNACRLDPAADRMGTEK
jgi:uncharacterized protein YqgV (UPF0045/DUF77 family)